MSKKKRITLILIVTFLATITLPSVSYLQIGNDSIWRPVNIASDESPFLEVNRAANIRADSEPKEIRVVSYNIRWRGGDDLRMLIELLKGDTEIGNPTILGLQEVDRNKRRTGNINTVKIIAEELGMYYAWAGPPPAKAGEEEETGVAILSPYALRDVERIVLPHKGPGGRRRVALGATVMIGVTPIRFYSVHSETRLQVAKKIEQMKSVLDDLAKYPQDMPAIVLGDLNTWENRAQQKTIELFSAENFTTPFNNGKSTFQRKVMFVEINLKLDWIWLRGFQSSRHGIDTEIRLSDHWPLWTVLKVPENNQGRDPAQTQSEKQR